MSWTVYILQCSDGTYYTGITNDLPRRLLAHNQGKGAKYTRGRSPLSVVYTEQYPDRAQASMREWVIKQLSRKQKESLIHDQQAPHMPAPPGEKKPP